MNYDTLSESLTGLHPLRAEVDLEALRQNVGILKRVAGDAELLGVVKANAYGHGDIPIAHELIACGVKRLGVANLMEGIELREAGIEVPVLVLAAPLTHTLSAYARYRLTATVTSLDVCDAIVEEVSRSGPLTVHIKVDTGMTRLGLLPEEVPTALETLRNTAGITVEGMLTHYATVDHDFTLTQTDRFNRVLAGVEDQIPLAHGANSRTLLFTPETVHGNELVRVGGSLFGLIARGITQAAGVDLQQVMRLTSRVVHLRDIEPGTSVSYDRLWTASVPTRIATIAAGYGDGLPRSLANRGEVGIGETRYPIVGQVCMDMFMVEVGREADVHIGDEVVIFGPGGPTAVEVSVAAETIAYDVTSGLTPRVQRVYINERE